MIRGHQVSSLGWRHMREAMERVASTLYGETTDEGEPAFTREQISKLVEDMFTSVREAK